MSLPRKDGSDGSTGDNQPFPPKEATESDRNHLPYRIRLDTLRFPDGNPVVLDEGIRCVETGFWTTPANCRKLRLAASAAYCQDGKGYLTFSLADEFSGFWCQQDSHDGSPGRYGLPIIILMVSALGKEDAVLISCGPSLRHMTMGIKPGTDRCTIGCGIMSG